MAELEAKTFIKMQCLDFLQIYLNSSWITIDVYCKYCIKNNKDPDKEIEKLKFKYKDKEYSFSDYNLDLKLTSQKFENDLEHNNDYLNDEFVFIYNPDFYRSIKFFKQLGYNISTACYYANKSYIKLPETFTRIKSYADCFLIRSFDFNTAIMWYNTCFDYILQAFCARFCLYNELTTEDTKKMNFKDLVKLVDFEAINSLAANHSSNREFNVWIKNIRKCRQDISNLNNTTNILKHRGGVKIKNFDLDPLMRIEKDAKCNLDYFNVQEIDIDENFQLLIDSHNSIVKCYKTLLKKLYKDISIVESNNKIIKNKRS